MKETLHTPGFCIEYFSIDASCSSEARGLLGAHHEGQRGVALYEGGVARGLHHGHGVGRDAVAVGGHRGRVDQDGGGGGHVAALEAGVQ